MEAIAGIVSAAIALIGLLIVAAQWREASLRRTEVTAWSLLSIQALQSLHLITIFGTSGREESLDKVKFDTSVLVEQGRLFFKNKPYEDFGAEKPPAYRGLRPVILDQLVIAHQIACNLENADDDRRLRMRGAAENAVRSFVSFAQAEVGRNRPASEYANMAGQGISLNRILNAIDDEQIANLNQRPQL
jgi:hypothetical protein